jgi:hypothetical protein
MKFVRFIIFLSIPFTFLYPYGLFPKLYLNYIYIILCFLLLFITKRKICYNYAAVKIFVFLFLGNLIACTISLISNNITITQFYAGVNNELSPLLLSIIICNSNILSSSFPNFKKVVLYTFIFVSVIIFIDGFFSPVWLYKLFYNSYENNEMLVNALEKSSFHRACGSLLSPVMAGTFSATIILYSFSYVIHNQRKIFCSALGILGFLCLLLTTSRTAILSLLITILYYCCFINRSFLKLFLIISLLSISIFVISNEINNSVILGLLNNLNERNGNLNSGLFEGTGRYDTFIYALYYKFDMRCLFCGIGDSEYSIAVNGFSFAHNGFLSILIPKGIWGCVCYFYLYKIYLKRTSNKSLVFKSYPYFDFLKLWLIFSLLTFLSADLPMSLFWAFLLVIFLSYFDCLYKRLNE